MSNSMYIAGTGPGSGKAVVVLGFMDLLARRGQKLGFFRPVVAGGTTPDPLTGLIASRYQLALPPESLFGVTVATARELLTQNRPDELQSQILLKYRALAERCDFVVAAGTDYRSVVDALELDFNLEVARNLGAPVVPVLSGQERSAGDIYDAVGILAESLEARKTDVLALFVNRVAAAATASLATRLRQDPPCGLSAYVLPEVPLLAHPTLGEIKAALQARLLHGDAERLEREALDYKVAAMELPHFLDHLSEGCLVITPGDRSDIVLGTLLAHASGAYPGVAGLLLTGDLAMAPQIERLIGGLRRSPLPILAVKSDTFTTATALHSVPAALGPGNTRKIAAALRLFDTHVDRTAIEQRMAMPRSPRLTPLMFQEDLIARARDKRRRIVLPEGSEERVLRAAEMVRLRDVVDLTLLGNPEEIHDKIAVLGLSLEGVTIIDPSHSELLEEFGKTYHELRKHKGISAEMARDAMTDVSAFGTMLVYQGRADGMVSGAVHTTQHTIRPALEFVKTRKGCPIISSVFFMCLPDRVLVYGDCAINPNPDSTQLAHIAISSADTARSFGIEPRIAMLSYSTGESGKGADVDKVKEATRIARELRPELKLEGPIQYDAAIDPDVARVKLPKSEVAGRATVFIFPDLNAGNNAYKAVQRAANAVAIGPVLQGLNKPVNDLSRGCTVIDIVNTIAVTAIQAGEGEVRG